MICSESVLVSLIQPVLMVRASKRALDGGQHLPLQIRSQYSGRISVGTAHGRTCWACWMDPLRTLYISSAAPAARPGCDEGLFHVGEARCSILRARRDEEVVQGDRMDISERTGQSRANPRCWPIRHGWDASRSS